MAKQKFRKKVSETRLGGNVGSTLPPCLKLLKAVISSRVLLLDLVLKWHKNRERFDSLRFPINATGISGIKYLQADMKPLN